MCALPTAADYLSCVANNSGFGVQLASSSCSDSVTSVCSCLESSSSLVSSVDSSAGAGSVDGCCSDCTGNCDLEVISMDDNNLGPSVGHDTVAADPPCPAAATAGRCVFGNCHMSYVWPELPYAVVCGGTNEVPAATAVAACFVVIPSEFQVLHSLSARHENHQTPF